MPKTTKSSAQRNNQLPLSEEAVPSSQEELSSSEQDPDLEAHFIKLDHLSKFQACSSLT